MKASDLAEAAHALVVALGDALDHVERQFAFAALRLALLGRLVVRLDRQGLLVQRDRGVVVAEVAEGA